MRCLHAFSHHRENFTLLVHVPGAHRENFWPLGNLLPHYVRHVASCMSKSSMPTASNLQLLRGARQPQTLRKKERNVDFFLSFFLRHSSVLACARLPPLGPRQSTATSTAIPALPLLTSVIRSLFWSVPVWRPRGHSSADTSTWLLLDSCRNVVSSAPHSQPPSLACRAPLWWLSQRQTRAAKTALNAPV